MSYLCARHSERIAFVLDEFTEKGDKVIIQPPVYHPFRIITEGLERQVVTNPLVLENGRYRMDVDGLKKTVAENDCKVFIYAIPIIPEGEYVARGACRSSRNMQ